ncbi:hypothetical protein GCM10007874_64940 [Labrys miyagiensis]|uniref:Uncharacterized protein n=1 Tax=Labrys miyagiensis TaxID=346912 RepID=A0ABQ6CT34_9HYPH|nr:hypothetical protein [Labrys miyagiensis]GLS23473.1 hypothetical protein GCM10007874_64940 [Labrys miyagiensis]
MLKVTLLTCAIIAAQPLIEGARAGDAMPASLSMVWMGRFVNTTRAPVLGSTVPSAEAQRKRRTDGDGNGDPDIVGSIPPDAAGNPARDIAMLRGTQILSLCAMPGLVEDNASDSLACGGVRHNRWSAKAATFNYDLSAVKPGFMNAPTPYTAAWDSLPAVVSPPATP